MLQIENIKEFHIKLINLIANQDRVNLLENFCSDDFENKIETTLQNILLQSSTQLQCMMKLFHLIDTVNNDEIQTLEPYTIGKRKLEIINTSELLENMIFSIQKKPFISFDSEQKPTFKKGQKAHEISLIQIATHSHCYLIQTQQITNIKPLINLLGDEKIIKIGTGLKGDNEALFKQFKLRLRATIDLENIFKKLSAKNQVGAKKAASIILNKKLQKSKKMSRSNWENKELTPGQIKYASEDATVVYDVMYTILEDYPFTLNLLPEFFQKQYTLQE